MTDTTHTTAPTDTSPDLAQELPLESYRGKQYLWATHPRTPVMEVTEITGIGALANVVLQNADGELKREIPASLFRSELALKSMRPIEDAGTPEEDSPPDEKPAPEASSNPPTLAEEVMPEICAPDVPSEDPVHDAAADEIAKINADGAVRFADAHPGLEARIAASDPETVRECKAHGPWTFDGTQEGSECPECAKAWILERAAYEKRVEGETCANEVAGHTPGTPVLKCPGCQATKESVDAFFKAQGHVPQSEATPKKRGRKGADALKVAAPDPIVDKEPETFDELKAARDRAREEVNRYEAKMREMLEAERARKRAELDELDRLGTELGLSA